MHLGRQWLYDVVVLEYPVLMLNGFDLSSKICSSGRMGEGVPRLVVQTGNPDLPNKVDTSSWGECRQEGVAGLSRC